MRFFRITSDTKWKLANDCEAWTKSENDSECVLPPIGCATCGSKTRDTRNPGYAYPAMRPDKFPQRLRKQLGYGEVNLKDWKVLRKEVIAWLPYPVPIAPCALFGPGLLEVFGKFADCYFGDGRLWLSKLAVERLKNAGADGLFPVPAKIRARRKLPDEYFELQIEHSAQLHGSLDRTEIEADLQAVDALYDDLRHQGAADGATA
ncbi:MAG: hypothetical protein HUU20_24380 [Pirellulales bacterium]|nr:hypothetical protein [Pirellulales bacterium]